MASCSPTNNPERKVATYLVIVSLCEATLAELAPVLSSLMQIWLVVLGQMLSHIALLSKRLPTKLAVVRFYANVHADVVEEVPSAHELFSSILKISDVDHNRFPVFSVCPQLTFIRDPACTKFLKVFPVGVRSLVLDNIPTARVRVLDSFFLAGFVFFLAPKFILILSLELEN